MINFSLTQLTYIVAVDTHKNFVKAAESVHVSQPTLSMQIKKMENDLGVTIFDRTKQPVMPTEIGEKIIAKAREILKHAEHINELIQDYNGVLMGTINIGIIPSLASSFLPKFLPTFAKKYPDLTININELYTENILEELKKDKLDFGIVVTPVKDEKIIEKPLFYEEIMPYFNKNHPLLQKKKLTVADLQCEDLWVLSEGNCFRSQVLNLCANNSEKAGSSKNIHFDSNTIETLVRFVDKEGGYTFVPQMIYENFSEKKKRKLKKINGLTPLREVSLVHTRTFTKATTIQEFIEHIKKSAPEEMLDKSRGTVIEWC
ncbi:MAG TPA: DNA-binding transcriptional regulator OxyR [Flavobacteriales bacterium]|nr:DNA-binding transcriptional regulator OxyR [Flavobacteriales bacterium]|tara:strand:+ start:27520 stop:28470 length:951 start_codon:yes stop_codon:yes gene_type:complete